MPLMDSYPDAQMKTKTLTLIAAGLVIAGLAYVLLPAGKAPPAAPVTAAQAPRAVAAEGKVETVSGRDADVGSGQLFARIKDIPVREGEAVKAGQVVVQLVDDDYRARLASAEAELEVARARLRETAVGSRQEERRIAQANLDAARAALDEAARQLERQQRLKRDGMVSDAAVDQSERAQRLAEAQLRAMKEQKTLVDQGARAETRQLLQQQVQSAEAAVALARQQLALMTLRAPIDGIVIRRYMDPGEGVTADLPILRVADMGQLRINAEIDETDVGRVQVGDPVEVRSLAFPGQVFMGKVERLSDMVGGRRQNPNDPTANLAMKVLEVRIALDQETPLRLGMSVDVRILVRRP